MRRKREARRFFVGRHGRKQGRARMMLPATPHQVKALIVLGMSRSRARMLTRGEASVEIS